MSGDLTVHRPNRIEYSDGRNKLKGGGHPKHSYSFSTFDVPSASSGTFPVGVNNLSVVAGYYVGGSDLHGFVYDNGAITTFDVPGANDTRPTAINNHGDITGNYSRGFNLFPSQGFIYHDGAITSIDVPDASQTIAGAINDRGEVAGDYIDSSGRHGFVYDNGAFTTFNPPDGGQGTTVSSINNHGEVTGTYFDNLPITHGFIYDNDVAVSLDIPGASSTVPQAINNQGEIAGFYVGGTIESAHGFVYDDGTFTIFDAPGATDTFAYAVNNHGEVAGYYLAAGAGHGFVYQNGVVTTINVPGATATFVFGLNNRGEVTGDYLDASGFHGFTASPADGKDATGTAGLSNLVLDQGGQLSATDFLSNAAPISFGSSLPQSSSDALNEEHSIGTSPGMFPFAGNPDAVVQVAPNGNG